ncbi:MAG: hypothetical protein WAQ52_08360 [Terriglobales bacterium]
MRAFTIAVVLSFGSTLVAQVSPSPQHPTIKTRAPTSAIVLHETSRKSIASEQGGAFMFPSKCDGDGNLYIRKYATDRPLLSPVVKIDSEGKRVALFDPAAFSQLKLDRADAFEPAPDGGLYQIATVGITKPQPYVLRFSPDGSPEPPIRIDAEFHSYQFTPFANGNLLVSGVHRDPDRSATGHPLTAVFSADGRLLTKLNLKRSEPSVPVADAEPGADGNIYAIRGSLPVLFYVISPTGDILRKLRIPSPSSGAMPQTFHLSANRLAVSFWDDATDLQTFVITDTQTGRRIATYSDPGTLSPSFACYSADEGVFTFLHLGEGNTLEVIRAEAR